MAEREPASLPVLSAAREARELLASALELLQRGDAVSAASESVVEHAASAASALYRAEAEARTPEAAAHGIHQALERVGTALQLLKPAREAIPDAEVAATLLARTLALLFPLARAAQRPRRGVVLGELSDADRRALALPAAPDAAPRAPGPDRRSSPARVHLSVDVGLFSGAAFYAASALDLSATGLFVSSHQLLSAESQVSVYFVLPGGDAVEARGIVRWTRSDTPRGPAGMAIEFTDLSPQDRARISQYCRDSGFPATEPGD